MDWPIIKDWKCHTCGENKLIWGLANGSCRCKICETEYMMKDENNNIIATPRCCLKEEYVEGVKQAWKDMQKPLSEWTAADVKKYLEVLD